MAMTNKTNKWISRIFIFAKLISRSNVLNKYLLVLILLLNTTAANAEVQLRSLNYEREFRTGYSSLKLADGKNITLRFNLDYSSVNAIPENAFGLHWCPALRDEGISAMPLQMKLTATKDEIGWGSCNTAFMPTITFKLVKVLSSDLKNRTMQNLLDNQYTKEEEFIFIEKSVYEQFKADINNKEKMRQVLRSGGGYLVVGLDRKLGYGDFGTSFFVEHLQSRMWLDKNGKLFKIRSTNREYNIKYSADGNIDKIVYEYKPAATPQDTAQTVAKPTELELMQFSYRDNGLLERVVFDKKQDVKAEFTYDPNRNWVQILDTWGDTIKMTYDNQNRLKDMIWPDESRETIFYNATTGYVSGFIERGFSFCMLTYKFLNGKNEQNYKTFETKTCSGKVENVREFSLITNENGEEKESITTLDADGQVKR